MQKELFEFPYECTIVESNSWIPLVDKCSVDKLTVNFETYDPLTNSFGIKPPMSYAHVEFTFRATENSDPMNFIQKLFGFQKLKQNICIIFRNEGKTFLVHDALIYSASFNESCEIVVEAKSPDVEIY